MKFEMVLLTAAVLVLLHDRDEIIKDRWCVDEDNIVG